MIGYVTLGTNDKAKAEKFYMVGLYAGSPEKVDAVYNKAISLGAKDEGRPGPRGGGGFYVAYFRDLDGNKLNAFCMVPKK